MNDCLGCEKLTTGPVVTLRNGTVVCNECPAWRHETEVRHVLNMGTNDDRSHYLSGVAEKRGEEAANRLRTDVWELMKAKL